MGSKTFLTHRRCGGNVVIDASAATKMYAPSFSINAHGITSLVLDIDVISTGQLTPRYWCRKCDTVFGDDLGKSLDVVCTVCGNAHPVSETSVHHQLTTICNECVEKIKLVIEGKEDESCDIAKDYVNMYSLSKIKLVSLEQVLKSPIKI